MPPQRAFVWLPNSVCLILEIFTLQPPLPHKHGLAPSVPFSEFVSSKFEYMDSPSIKQVDLDSLPQDIFCRRNTACVQQR